MSEWKKLASLLMVCAAAVGCDSDADIDDAPGVVGGRFTLTWTLMVSGQEVTCREAGAGEVVVISTHEATDEVFRDAFPCSVGSGTTELLPLGLYTVVVELIDENGVDVLSRSDPIATELEFNGDIVDLGLFNFDFAGAGDVNFFVDFGAPGGSNCVGGIAGEIVELQPTTLSLFGEDACFDTTLLVDGVVDVPNICTEIPPCIEVNQLQTLVDVPPGSYELVIEGAFDVGTALIPCFFGVFSFDVSGPTDLGTLLVPFDDLADPLFCSQI